MSNRPRRVEKHRRVIERVVQQPWAFEECQGCGSSNTNFSARDLGDATCFSNVHSLLSAIDGIRCINDVSFLPNESTRTI
jgi:hypothetical protein